MMYNKKVEQMFVLTNVPGCARLFLGPVPSRVSKDTDTLSQSAISALRGIFVPFEEVIDVSEERSFPLNNPLQERAVADARGNKIITTRNSVSSGKDRGVSKGGKERAKPIEAILKCQSCSRLQKLVFTFGNPPNYHRCIWCGELQPTDGYRVISYGLGLPTPLAPHEVRARRREVSYNPQR